MSVSIAWPDNPLIGILRGLPPEDAGGVAKALVSAGIRVLEVPLMDEDAYRSIEAVASSVGDDVLVGAGTVLTPTQVRRAKNCGAQLIVSPNLEPEVVQTTLAASLLSCPGVFTPTETLRAFSLGVSTVKLFPANLHGQRGLQALRVVLPSEARVVPVGGVEAGGLGEWRTAGAWGVGVGTDLYSPSRPIEETRRRAERLSTEWAKAVAE